MCRTPEADGATTDDTSKSLITARGACASTGVTQLNKASLHRLLKFQFKDLQPFCFLRNFEPTMRSANASTL